MELRRFDMHRDTRIVCDASHNGLGAVLEQLNSDGWRPISFAPRYLNEADKKFSMNDLKCLQLCGWRNISKIMCWGKIFNRHGPQSPGNAAKWEQQKEQDDVK